MKFIDGVDFRQRADELSAALAMETFDSQFLAQSPEKIRECSDVVSCLIEWFRGFRAGTQDVNGPSMFRKNRVIRVKLAVL